MPHDADGQPPILRLPGTAADAPTVVWRDGTAGAGREGVRAVPEETAVAMTFNRLTHAVMMATPADLEDFATGFSLSEGVVEAAGDIEELEFVAAPQGIELRMWIAEARMAAMDRRRRSLAGPTGCGLCGLESLDQAMRPVPRIRDGFRVRAGAIAEAMAAMGERQALNAQTRAVHAAGFWTPRDGMAAVREDVGRHNALDKLAGAVARAGLDGAGGLVAMTSRISVELVQKAAAMGVPVLAAVSAPTALAVRVAREAGMTLVGVARRDGFEVFTHPERIVAG